MISSPQFRRLNSLLLLRIGVWDLSSSDAVNQPLSLIVVPTDDLRPTEAQRQIFKAGLSKFIRPGQITKTGKTRPGMSNNRTLTLQALLATRKMPVDYSVALDGPLSYDRRGYDAARLYKLLDKFLVLGSFEHPVGILRVSSRYRQTVRDTHRCLYQQHYEATYSQFRP